MGGPVRLAGLSAGLRPCVSADVAGGVDMSVPRVTREVANNALARGKIPWRTDAGRALKRAWCDAALSALLCWKFHTRCARCPQDSYDVHHIIGKDLIAYRYHPKNVIALCRGCHKTKRNSAESDGCGFAKWLHENRPEQWAWQDTALRNFMLPSRNYEAIWNWLLRVSTLSSYEEFFYMPPWYEWEGATG